MDTKMEMSYHRPVVTRLKLMGEMDIAEKRLPQDGKYRYEKEEMATDLRISTLPSVYGEKVVLLSLIHISIRNRSPGPDRMNRE